MNKICLILVVMLALFMITSTVGIAADLGLSTSSSETAETATPEASAPAESSEPAEEVSESVSSVTVQEDPETAPLNGNIPPVADFDYSNDGVIFSFFDQSIDEDGYIDEWYWNFNDGWGTISTEQNPIIDFTQSAGHELTVSLTVWDNNGAYDIVNKDIIVPEDDSVSEEVSGNTNILESEEQTSLPSSVSSSSTSQSTGINTAYVKNLFVANSFDFLTLSRALNTNNPGGSGILLLGNPCDLDIDIIKYNPQPPEKNEYLTIDFEVTNDDSHGVYDGEEVTIYLEIDELGIFLPFDRPFNGDPQNVFFKWPDEVGEVTVNLTVNPKPLINWSDVNWDNNLDYFYDGPEDDVSVGSSSIATFSSTSSGSSIIGNTLKSNVIIYGSASL